MGSSISTMLLASRMATQSQKTVRFCNRRPASGAVLSPAVWSSTSSCNMHTCTLLFTGPRPAPLVLPSPA